MKENPIVMTIISEWFKNQRKRTDSVSVSGLIKETALPLYDKYLSTLNKELSRIRRFEHSLAIAVLKKTGFHPDQVNKKNPKAEPQLFTYPSDNDVKPISEIEFILCGLVVKNSIRDIDIIVYDPTSHQFIISFPETNIGQAHHTIKRIKKLIGNRMADQLAFGLAEFPQNGLILNDLIEYAVLACNS
jgi:hypothetical protein